MHHAFVLGTFSTLYLPSNTYPIIWKMWLNCSAAEKLQWFPQSYYFFFFFWSCRCSCLAIYTWITPSPLSIFFYFYSSFPTSFLRDPGERHVTWFELLNVSSANTSLSNTNGGWIRITFTLNEWSYKAAVFGVFRTDRKTRGSRMISPVCARIV